MTSGQGIETMTKQEFSTVTAGSAVYYNGKAYTVRTLVPRHGAMRLVDSAGVPVKDMTRHEIMSLSR
jgi:tartrate dehydratase beta subunit/fumarate hydratase class I family protein